MVIAKSEWFGKRYLGWGRRPVTWQGWTYVLVLVGLIAILVHSPLAQEYKVIDIGGTMVHQKDEREKIHEAIAERNALWAIVLVSAGILAYQFHLGDVDWLFLGAIFLGLVVKAASNIWLDKKD